MFSCKDKLASVLSRRSYTTHLVLVTCHWSSLFVSVQWSQALAEIQSRLRGGRNPQDFRSLLDSKPAKKPELNDPTLLRVEACQSASEPRRALPNSKVLLF